MATKFIESGTDATQGFEFYSSTIGTVASDSTQSQTGPRSIKCSTGSPSTAAGVTRSGVLADAGRRISVWFRTDTTPGTSLSPIIAFKADGTTVVCSLSINSSRQIGASATGIAPVFGTTVIALNTWTRLTMAYYITNTTTFAVKVYLNGGLEATINTGTLTNTGSDTLQLRASSSLPANTNYWFDNIYVDDGASSASQPDTGAIRVTAKRPIANGTTNGFTATGTPSGYGSGNASYVNEQPLNTANYVSVGGAGAAITEEYNLEGEDAGDVNIEGVTIVDVGGWVYTKALIAETGQIVVDGVSSNIAIPTSNALFTAFAGKTTYPAGTGTDIGEVTSTTVTTVTLYECGMVVAYRVKATGPLFRQAALSGLGGGGPFFQDPLAAAREATV